MDTFLYLRKNDAKGYNSTNHFPPVKTDTTQSKQPAELRTPPWDGYTILIDADLSYYIELARQEQERR